MATTMASNIILKFRTFVLGPVFGLERQEYWAVAWSFVCFFCVLSSYYIMRPVREAMAVDSGADTVPLLFTATFVVMMVATTVFGWVASRYPRRVFLPWVYLFFIANILLFWLIFSQIIDDGRDHIWLGRVFFVWISVFNLFVVSVFWSFMADIYTRDQGRRLFGFIAAGGSIGAICGGAVTSLLVVKIGFENLLPIAAILLALAMFCIYQLNRWFEREQVVEVQVPADLGKPLGGNLFGGITHVFQSNYFVGIAVCSIIASLLGTALYMFPIQLVEDSIAGTSTRALPTNANCTEANSTGPTPIDRSPLPTGSLTAQA